MKDSLFSILSHRSQGVLDLRQPQANIKAVFECTDSLESYSGLVARSPDAEILEFLKDSPHIKNVEFEGDSQDWSVLKNLDQVEELTFSHCYALNEELFNLFPKLPRLRKLTFHDCESLKNTFFREFAKWNRLESLHLSYCLQNSIFDQRCFDFFSKLRHLKVDHCFDITDLGAALIAKLSQLVILELDLTKELTDKGFEALCQLTQIQRFSLEDCQGVSSRGYLFLCNLKNITHLYLRNVKQLTDQGFKVVSSLEKLIELLLTSAKAITEDSFKHLAKLQQLQALVLDACNPLNFHEKRILPPNLKKLSLESTSLDFSSIGPSNSLEYLNLNFNKDPLIDTNLKSLQNFPKLNHLEIKYCAELKGEGFQFLRPLTELRVMDLEGCSRLQDECLGSFSSLENLTRLNLEGCPGFLELTHLSQCRTLKVLNLQKCEYIRDAALCEVGGLLLLEEVNLSNCNQLTDEGLKQLKGLKFLRRLYLCNSQFTQKGIYSMYPLDALEELHIDLYSRKFSQEALRDFFRVFPSLKLIDFGGIKLKSENFILDIVSQGPRAYRLLSSG